MSMCKTAFYCDYLYTLFYRVMCWHLEMVCKISLINVAASFTDIYSLSLTLPPSLSLSPSFFPSLSLSLPPSFSPSLPHSLSPSLLLGMYGQLGHGSTEKQSSPRVVEALSEKTVYLLACGNFHTVSMHVYPYTSHLISTRRVCAQGVYNYSTHSVAVCVCPSFSSFVEHIIP